MSIDEEVRRYGIEGIIDCATVLERPRDSKILKSLCEEFRRCNRLLLKKGQSLTSRNLYVYKTYLLDELIKHGRVDLQKTAELIIRFCGGYHKTIFVQAAEEINMLLQ